MGTVKTRREAEEKIIEQAARDQEFRNKLLSDAKPAVESAIGMKLPEAVMITVLQATDRQLYHVLPPQAARQDGELTDSELSAVAGGIDRNAGKAGKVPGVGDFANPAADISQKVNSQFG